MNLNTISKRVERLENHGHKASNNIKIVYQFDKWVVIKDGEKFDTLRDAAAHVKRNYSASNVKVNQVDYVLDKMSSQELREVVAACEDDADPSTTDYSSLSKVIEPCDQVKEVQDAYSTMHFELVIEDPLP